MNNVWNLNFDEYFEICKRARGNGKKAGDSMEEELVQYMKEKNRKPIAKTNKDLDQLTGDLREEGLKVLNVNEIERRINNE